eukprot:4281451-Pyramimonas_sp.AAC.1
MPLMKILRGHQEWTSKCKLGCSGFSNSISITNENDVWDLIRVDPEGNAVWNQTDCEDWGITADLMTPITNMLNLS